MPPTTPCIAACRRNFMVAALLLLCCLNTFAQEDLLGRAAEDLQSGNTLGAYSRLNAEADNRAGDPAFDYLLGLSALAAGHNSEAIFAFERVLSLQPENLNARLAIGRAHLALQETDAAKKEFQTVQALDGSESTRATIQRYLKLTEQLEASARFSARIYLEFTLGYDSNVNSASDVDQVAVPSLGGLSFVIADSSQRQSDGFLALGGSVNIQARLSPRTTLVAGLGLTHRFNQRFSAFDTETYELSLGLVHNRGLNVFGASLQLAQINIDHPEYSAGYRDSAGATLQWVRNLEGNAQWSNYYQFVVLDYPGQDARDAQRHVLGTAYAKGTDAGLTGFLGLYGGIEKESKPALSYLGHELVGVRLGGDYLWSNGVALFANANYEYRRYRGEDITFLTVRKDHQYVAAAGMHFAMPAKGWRLSPQISFVEVRSNIDINSYDRWQIQVTMRGEL